MGLFGGLRDKFSRKKNDDLDEIRAGVLNERFEQEPLSTFNQQPLRPEPTQQRAYEDFQNPYTRDTNTESMSLEPVNRENVTFEPARSADNNYEVMDRLRFIENQLSAIRSQTELINERLKNIELKLGRPRF